jgi:hypothetical protein
MWRLAVYLVVVSLALPQVALAQQQSPADQPPVDASKLGVSLDRIRGGLRQAEAAEASGTALRLDYRVEVFGTAPKIDFLAGFPLTGPVPGSAPTHREVVDFLTPQQFKSPVVPIYGLAIWAAQKLAERAKKSRCEQEIEEYRQLLMQGVAVAAPRCTQ